ncbi:MAG: HlyD family efflux transporter periplasmic adaptor subunit [Bryobacterales bacterium]
MAENASRKRWLLRGGLFAVVGAAVTLAAMNLYTPATREVPTARVERRDFLNTVRARGEVKSARSAKVVTPATPNLTIVRLAENGKPIKRGEIVVAFDSSTQEDQFIERRTMVREVESEILQAEAQHSIADETNAMATMKAQYDVERAELEASKQEILSEIEGLKNRIDVTIAEGVLSQEKTKTDATDLSQRADLRRIEEKKDKATRDLETTQAYLGSMVLRAPADGIVHIMTNNRANGSFGTSRPPFQEGDTVWTGATIAEIPDLSSLQVEFRVEEIDRGRVEVGQPVRIRVDAVPDLLMEGEVEWMSPIATLVFRRFPPEKNFPAQATIRKLDPRLRPGMSATVEVIVDRRPDELVIPNKASFQIEGQPTVYVKAGAGFRSQPIEVVTRNSTEIVVHGVEEGQVIALENPEITGPRRRR